MLVVIAGVGEVCETVGVLGEAINYKGKYMYNIIVYLKDENYGNGEYNIQDKQIVLNDYILPYLSNETFFVEGKECNRENVKQIIVSESNEKIDTLIQKAKYEHKARRSFYFATKEVVGSDNHYVKIITANILKEGNNFLITKQKSTAEKTSIDAKNRKIFIVYGHDENALLKVSQFLEKLDFTPIVLSDKSNGGKTIIEKLEENADVGFAIVLYTPDDLVKKDKEEYKQPRPNVIFEYGYFMAKLGRDRVALLQKDEVKENSDILGTAYIKMDDNEGWKMQVAKELKAAGYDVDLNKIL